MTKLDDLYEVYVDESQQSILDYQTFCYGVTAAITILEESPDRYRKEYFISLIKEALNDNH